MGLIVNCFSLFLFLFAFFKSQVSMKSLFFQKETSFEFTLITFLSLCFISIRTHLLFLYYGVCPICVIKTKQKNTDVKKKKRKKYWWSSKLRTSPYFFLFVFWEKWFICFSDRWLCIKIDTFQKTGFTGTNLYIVKVEYIAMICKKIKK